MPEATEPTMRRAWLFVATLVAAGCGSCRPAGGRDAGNVDAARDGGEADASDGDAADADTDQPDPDALPPPVPVELVEVPREREGMECGPGCRQLTFAAPVFQAGFSVSRTHLAYRGDTLQGPLHLVDLGSGREYQLDACEGYWCSYPTVSREQVVFPTREVGDQRDTTLWRYRIGDPVRTPLVRRHMTDRRKPLGGVSVHGDRVAWWDSAISLAGLYAMSLEGGSVADLTPEHCLCYGGPRLVGRHVVYEGWPTGQRDIWIVDVDSLERENLTSYGAPQFVPAFDGEWVVWTDGRNDPSSDPYGSLVNPDVYGMQLSSREETALVEHPAVQIASDVGEGFVLWEDYRNAADPNDAWDVEANVDIYLLELETRREVQVTSLPGQELNPSIVGRNVYFVTEDAIGQQAVFVVNLDDAGLL